MNVEIRTATRRRAVVGFDPSHERYVESVGWVAPSTFNTIQSLIAVTSDIHAYGANEVTTRCQIIPSDVERDPSVAAIPLRHPHSPGGTRTSGEPSHTPKYPN